MTVSDHPAPASDPCSLSSRQLSQPEFNAVSSPRWPRIAKIPNDAHTNPPGSAGPGGFQLEFGDQIGRSRRIFFATSPATPPASLVHGGFVTKRRQVLQLGAFVTERSGGVLDCTLRNRDRGKAARCGAWRRCSRRRHEQGRLKSTPGPGLRPWPSALRPSRWPGSTRSRCPAPGAPIPLDDWPSARYRPGGARAVGQWLELAALVRAWLLAGPLHQLGVAGFCHGQKGIGIQACHWFEWTVHDGTAGLDVVDQTLALAQPALDGGVIGLDQGVAHSGASGVQVDTQDGTEHELLALARKPHALFSL